MKASKGIKNYDKYEGKIIIKMLKLTNSSKSLS